MTTNRTDPAAQAAQTENAARTRHPASAIPDIDTAPLVRATDLAKTFDVSAPWLNRVIER